MMGEPPEDLDDYADELASVEKYDYVMPSKKNFKAWHRPRKQFVRMDQWCHLTKQLIKDIQIVEGSLTYLGLPGADLLDLRCFSSTVCQPRALKLRFLGFDSGAAADSEYQSEFGISLDEISKLAEIDPLSEVLPDDLRALVNDKSVAWEKTKSIGPYDVINLDLCDGFGREQPEQLSPTYYDALARLLSVQARRKSPWLLFLTTRVNRRYVHEGTFERLKGLFSNNLATCAPFAAASERRFSINPTNIDLSRDEPFGHQRIFLVGLCKWLLALGIAQSPPSKVVVKNVLGYRVGRAAVAEDMISIALKFEPMDHQPSDSLGLAKRPPTALNECELAEKVVHAVSALVDVDDILANDAELMEEMITSTSSLLESARYDIQAYRRFVSGTLG